LLAGRRDVSKVALTLSASILVLFVLFGGNFARSNGITWILRWIQYISIVFYAYEALSQNELNGQVFDGVSGEFYLQLYSLDQVPIVACAGAILGIGVFFLLLAYVSLRATTRPKITLI